MVCTVSAANILTRERGCRSTKESHLYQAVAAETSFPGWDSRGLVAIAIVKIRMNHLKEMVWKAETPRQDCEKPPRCKHPPTHRGRQAGCAGRVGMLSVRTLLLTQLPVSPAASIPCRLDPSPAHNDTIFSPVFTKYSLDYASPSSFHG